METHRHVDLKLLQIKNKEFHGSSRFVQITDFTQRNTEVRNYHLHLPYPDLSSGLTPPLWTLMLYLTLLVSTSFAFPSTFALYQNSNTLSLSSSLLELTPGALPGFHF